MKREIKKEEPKVDKVKEAQELLMKEEQKEFDRVNKLHKDFLEKNGLQLAVKYEIKVVPKQ